MKFCLVLLTLFVLTSCSKQKQITDFTDLEKDELSQEILTALANDKIDILRKYMGFSRHQDSAQIILRSFELDDIPAYSNLLSPKILNQTLDSILDYLAYSIEGGKIEISSTKILADKLLITYAFQTKNKFYDFIEFEIITNGSQLFIKDFYIYSWGNSLGSIYLNFIYKSCLYSDYPNLIATAQYNLNKAIKELNLENYERAEFFYNEIPSDFAFEPTLVQGQLVFLSKLSLEDYKIYISEWLNGESENKKLLSYQGLYQSILDSDTTAATKYLQDLQVDTGENFALNELRKLIKNNFVE